MDGGTPAAFLVTCVGPFDAFYRALSAFLHSCGPGRPVLLSKVASAMPIVAEWSQLQSRMVISKGTKMKGVILERPDAFQVVSGPGNQPHVLLLRPVLPSAMAEASLAIKQVVAASASTAQGLAPGPASSAGLAAPVRPGLVVQGTASVALGSVAEAASGSTASGVACSAGAGGVCHPLLRNALSADQLTSIERFLHARRGVAKLSVLGSTFGVKKAQLAVHFRIHPAHGGDFAVALRQPLFAEPGESPTAGSRGWTTSAPESAVACALRGLEALMHRLVPSKHSVCDVTAFCLDNMDFAAALARRLVGALGDRGLGTQTALARLYAVSDIVSNCCLSERLAAQPAASKFLSSFQALLPEAFEQLGREWFRRIEGLIERSSAERKVRAVLSAWQRLGCFPRLFEKGLEALLLAPVRDDSAANPGDEPDPLLREKLVRWFSPADQGRLPYACQLRGLAGRSLPTAACRTRLCHFERFWHIPGVPIFEDADLFGDSLNAAAAGTPTRGASDVEAAAGGRLRLGVTVLGEQVLIPAASPTADPIEVDMVVGDGEPLGVDGAHGEDDLDGEDIVDGEPLTEEDWAALRREQQQLQELEDTGMLAESFAGVAGGRVAFGAAWTSVLHNLD